MTDASSVTHAVRDFYRDMPFNYYSDAGLAADSVARNPIADYPDLDALLEEDEIETVLELGCGAGWASNSMAKHYGKSVTAVDFTAAALARARDVSGRLGTTDQVRFVESDLFEFQSPDSFDLVVSVGVLHHTRDCRAAFAHAAQFVAPGGFLFVGLYHLFGRRPFLELFQGIHAREGEEAAFERFRSCASTLSDETHQRSWFRDQVLHPHETQHTLAEVWNWLDEEGLSLVSTSINQYQDVDDRPALEELEKRCEAISWQRNRDENSYYPGFFTILAQRDEA
ncbi:methyltransferase domain-containing protein [Phaeobacter sp. QD34_3]|uniref:SAM-dependent methyltransferase n=1 Tax=unclassified Phaeobacter TaxID=2621772 RepID=UPI00237F3D78|nr:MULTISPECIES: class I SAM-dependent methyltransferase [unclassified Phaeobacter]MDE4133891.1 methyltransferase domain-containing protein [Phaeobacter sp. QD34_3]MDE4137418.1 methyltransferase domain-containing protein [Phaeobacter sp. QD34_24]